MLLAATRRRRGNSKSQVPVILPQSESRHDNSVITVDQSSSSRIENLRPRKLDNMIISPLGKNKMANSPMNQSFGTKIILEDLSPIKDQTKSKKSDIVA